MTPLPAVSISVDRGALLDRQTEAEATQFDGDREYSLSEATTRVPLAVTVASPAAGTVSINGHLVSVGQPVRVDFASIDADDRITVEFLDSERASHRHIIHAKPSGMPSYLARGRTSVPGELALTVSGGARKPYLMLLDREGKLVFYRRYPDQDLSNLRKTTINGKTYYTYMRGTRILPIGYFEGKVYVMDDAFRIVQVIDGLLPNPAKGRAALVQNENHDFLLLGENHYLVSGYVPVMLNNVPGTSGAVKIVASVLQEVRDGSVVFEWDSTEHPELFSQSEEGNGFNATSWSDYVHFNSVWVDPADGNFVASFRNLNAILKIDRSTGAILWRYGGAADDFGLSIHQMPQGQHSAKLTADGALIYFDNNTTCIGAGPRLPRFHTPDGTGMTGCQQRDANSRVVKVRLDEAGKRVLSYQEWRVANDPQAIAVSGRAFEATDYRGSVQEMPNGHLLIGFGDRSAGDRDVADLDLVTGQISFDLFFDFAQQTPPQSGTASYRANFAP